MAAQAVRRVELGKDWTGDSLKSESWPHSVGAMTLFQMNPAWEPMDGLYWFLWQASFVHDMPSRRIAMTKSRDTKKDVKKKPTKTAKEKKKDKQEKKKGGGSVHSMTGND